MDQHTPTRRKRLVRRILKIAMIIAAAVVVAAAAVVFLAPLLVSTSAVERAISRQTQQSLGRPAHLGDFSLSLLGRLRVTLSDLVVEDLPEYGDRPLARIERLHAEVGLAGLLRNRLVVKSLVIDNAEFSVVRGRDGELNVSAVPRREEKHKEERPPEEKRAPSRPSVIVAGMRITGATIHFRNMATGESSSLAGLNAELVAEAAPAEGRATLTRAAVCCDGFSFSAAGSLEPSGEGPVLRDAVVRCTANMTKLDRQLSPILPVNIAGTATYNLAASGPLTAVSVVSRTELEGVRATGALLRKPAVIQDMIIEHRSVVNLRAPAVSEFCTRITSQGLGVRAVASGGIADAVGMSGIGLKLAAELDLAKLTGLTAAFSAQPLEASGEVALNAELTGDLPVSRPGGVPAGGKPRQLASKGSLRVRNLRLQNPRLPEPYIDEQMNLDYDVTLNDLPRLLIRRLDLESGLVAAQATGTAGPDTADLEASVRGNLGAACTLLAGLGVIPQGMTVDGRYVGRLGAFAAGDGVQLKASGTVRDLVVGIVRGGGRLREQMLTVDASALVSFAGGLPQGVRKARLQMVSKLAAVDADLAAEGLTTRPAFECTIRAKVFSLQRARQVLVELGIAENIKDTQGSARAVITIAGAAQRPLLRPPQPHGAGRDVKAAAKQSEPLLTLANLRVSVDLTADQIVYDELTVDRAAVKATLADSVLKANGHAELYRGAVAFAEETDLRGDKPAHSFQFSARKVTMTRELWRFINDVVPFFPLPLGRVEGVFDSDMRLQASGADEESLTRSLNGSGTVTMPEDVTVVVPFFRGLPGLDDYSNLQFGKMSSALLVDEGVTRSDTTFTAPDLTMRLTGTTDLVVQRVEGIPAPGRPINYRVSLKGERVGRDLKRLLNKKGELPVTLTGTVSNPRAKVRFEGILGPLEELFR